MTPTTECVVCVSISLCLKCTTTYCVYHVDYKQPPQSRPSVGCLSACLIWSSLAADSRKYCIGRSNVPPLRPAGWLWGTGYIMTRGNWLVSRLAGSWAAHARVASRQSHLPRSPSPASPHMRLPIHHHSGGSPCRPGDRVRREAEDRLLLAGFPRNQTSVETDPRARLIIIEQPTFHLV